MTDSEVVVAGGGLAGLTAAARLAEAGHDVTMFERESEVGGRVRSAREDGFTLDRGFQVLFTAYPAARHELDLDPLDLRSFSPGAVVCRGDRRSVLADPLRDPGSLVDSLLNREITTGDKLRTLALRRDLASKSVDDIFTGEDASIEDYLRDRGFSDRYVDRFVRPFYGGITLDRSLSTSKRAFEFTFKLLAEGDTVVPADGMGAITQQLAERAREAGVRIETDTGVDAVDATGDGATFETVTETVDADAAVVAADPKSSRELTGVAAIPTDARGCVTQHVALSDGHPIADRDRVHLNAGGEVPNTVAPMSGVAPEYAPGDRALLAVTTVGDRDESDDELARQARRALGSWYPEASLAGFEVLRTDRVPFSQFAQPPGVHETLPDTRDPDGAVYLAGDYTEQSSINGALESGATAARAVREDLR